MVDVSPFLWGEREVQSIEHKEVSIMKKSISKPEIKPKTNPKTKPVTRAKKTKPEAKSKQKPDTFAALRRKAEKKLKEKEEFEHFASFPQLNPNPVIEIDYSGKIIFSNRATSKILKEMNLEDESVFLPGI